MRMVEVILLVFVAGTHISCTDDGAPPPPPPWASWTRVPISADLSIGIHPQWWVTHAYDPAETTQYSNPNFSIARRGTNVAGYRSDFSTTYLPSVPANFYCRFETDSGFEGIVTLTDEPDHWGTGIYLRTIDRQWYMVVLIFTRYGAPSTPGELDEVVQMAGSLEYK